MNFYRSAHQKRIDTFMRKAKQELPSIPIIPNSNIRRLRAKLILEEALETITALGCEVVNLDITNNILELDIAILSDYRKISLPMIADGCADLSVVTIGTLSACGIHDLEILRTVDMNNLDKFGNGHYIRNDGKLIKPPTHKPPNLEHIINTQLPYNPDEEL